MANRKRQTRPERVQSTRANARRMNTGSLTGGARPSGPNRAYSPSRFDIRPRFQGGLSQNNQIGSPAPPMGPQQVGPQSPVSGQCPPGQVSKTDPNTGRQTCAPKGPGGIGMNKNKGTTGRGGY